MKWWGYLIIAGIEIFVLSFFLVIPVIILNQSWLWFIIPLIAIIIVDMATTIIVLIVKYHKKGLIKLEMSQKEIEEMIVNDWKYDNHNPDNFRIITRKIYKIGDRNSKKTPELILKGKGTENNDDRWAIINLDKPTQEKDRLINPSKEEIVEAIMKIADYPPEEIREEIINRLDEFSRPISVRKITKPSEEIKKQKEEEKQAEENTAI